MHLSVLAQGSKGRAKGGDLTFFGKKGKDPHPWDHSSSQMESKFHSSGSTPYSGGRGDRQPIFKSEFPEFLSYSGYCLSSSSLISSTLITYAASHNT